MFELMPFGYRRISAYNPFRDFEEMSRSFWDDSNVSAFRTDITEKDGKYILEADLPGFKKEDITCRLKDGYLTVSAEKGLDKNEEDKKGRVLRQERYAGACSRSFYVGDVKTEDIKAKYEHGVLTILVPKHDPKKLTSSSKVTIE